MKFKKSGMLIAMAFAAGAAVLPSASFAADGTITFTGSVTPSTCVISGNGGGQNFNVALQPVSAKSFQADGDFAMRTPFNIALSNCSPDSGSISLYFEPSASVDTTTGQLKNVNGTATNVEIGLLNADYSAIKLGAASGAQNSQTATLSSGAATLNYYAQYVRQGGVPTTGSVSTSTMYTIVYP